jgi:hypothetical protein
MLSSRASVGQQALLGKHPGSAQASQPLPGDEWIGIGHGGNDAAHTRRQQRVGARRRATLMTAGLKRHVDGRPARTFSGSAQSMHFGVLLAGAQMPAFADDLAIIDDDATDTRIGGRGLQTQLGQAQRPRHHFVIGGAETLRHQRPIFCGERETSRISLENSSTSSKLR